VKHATDLVGGKPPPRVFSDLKPRLESRGNSGLSPSGTAFRQSLFSSVCRRAAKLCFAVIRFNLLWRLSRRDILGDCVGKAQLFRSATECSDSAAFLKTQRKVDDTPSPY